MIYSDIAVAAVFVAVVVDLFVFKNSLLTRLAFWLSYMIILPFQLMTNWWLTHLRGDGKAIVMNANATPLMSNGLPLLDKNGKAVRVTSNGQITDSSGRVILGIDGKAIAIGKSESADVMKIGSILKSTVKAPDGSVAVMALNAQLFDKSGNPIVTDSGQPIFYDAKSKKLIDPKGNAVKVAAGGKIVGKVSSLAFQTVNFAT